MQETGRATNEASEGENKVFLICDFFSFQSNCLFIVCSFTWYVCLCSVRTAVVQLQKSECEEVKCLKMFYQEYKQC